MKSGIYEVISDVNGNYEEDNPCYHYRETYHAGAGTPFEVRYTGQTPSGLVCKGILRFPQGWSSQVSPAAIMNSQTVLGHHPSTGPSSRMSIPDFAWEGWNGVYPVIKKELGLLNSIYELKDFSKLPKLWRDSRQSLNKLDELSKGFRWTSESLRRGDLRTIYQLLSEPIDPHTWSRLLELRWSRIKRLSISEVFGRLVSLGKTTAAHQLNWSFAVKPLLSDVSASLRAATSFEQQLSSLLERAKKDVVHKSHWSTDVPPQYVVGLSLQDRGNAHNEGGQGTDAYRVIREVPDGIKYTFTARYSFTYPQMSYELARRLARMDALGIQISAANLWNAIPWTFVADWFVRIGPYLETLTPHNLEPVVTLHGACHSIKYTHVTRIELTPWVSFIGQPLYTFNVMTPAHVQTRTQEVYVRNGVLPFMSLPKTSDFSNYEKVLAAALMASSVSYNTL